MKKNLAALLFLAMTITFTGCLKDKGFENNEYGINDPDTQPAGVGFPLGANSKNAFGLNVSGTIQQADGLIAVNLEAGKTFDTDITITLANVSTELVTAYNTANGTNIQVLDPSLYSVPSLTLVIPAGQRLAIEPITITSTLTLDPNKSYGVGFRIVSVSNNLKIADNLKNLLIEFSIKNKYDGKYQLTGYHNRPGLEAPYDETVLMITSGPNSVSMYWPAISAYGHPLNGGVTYYGSFTTNFYFNLSTDLLTNWDLSPYPTTVTPSMGPATDSRYDASSKTIYANYYYNGNPAQRGFYDTLRYIGPR
jgi:hypothetical protein